MINDDYRIINKISELGIKALYFRDTNIKKLAETEYIHKVNKWRDV